MGDPHVQPCPECGLPPRQHVRPAPWWARRLILWQVLLLLAGALPLGWRWYANWPTWPPPTTSGPDLHTNTEFPQRRYTAADLERIAAGETSGIDLLRGLSLQRSHPGAQHVEISAQFGPPIGRLTEFQRIGWPAAWLTHRYDSDADDIYTREGSTPAASQRPVGTTLWSDRAHLRYGERGNRRHVRIFVPEALGGVLLIVLLGWSAGRMARAGATLLAAGRRGKRGAPGSRSVRALPWVGIAAGLGLVAVLSPESERVTDRYQRPFNLNGHATGLRYSEVSPAAADQAKLARAILDAVGDQRDGVLLLGTILRPTLSQSTASLPRWPGINLVHVTYGAPGVASRLRLQGDRHGLVLFLGSTNQSQTTVTGCSIRAAAAMNLLLLAVLLWQLPRATRLLALKLIKLRSHRRLARNLCLNCAYPQPSA